MRSQRRGALERDKFSKEKANASLLTTEKRHGRRAKKESGRRRELEGAGVPEAIDMRWAHPSSALQAGQTGILLLGQALGKGHRFWEEESLPQLEEEEWKMATAKPWEGSPSQGMKLGPCLSRQSSSGSRICPLLASSGQAMAQVSDTWGPESHARKLNTLEPQPPTSSSYEQAGLLEEEAGLQSRAAGRLLPGRGQPRRKLSHQQG